MLLFTLFMQTSQATEYCTEGSAKIREACLREKIAELEQCNPTKSIPEERHSKETFVDYSPCSFKVTLPQSYTLEVEDDNNLDICDATVTMADGLKIIEIHSTNSSRYETNDVRELYQRALAKSTLEITHKKQHDNWFVISGYNNEGKIVYWKRISGDNFISDLYMEYPKTRSSEINPKIGKIAGSFTCD